MGNVKHSQYVCVECGEETSMLYKRYSPTVLKLWQCDNCGQPVDKYIEYDNSVLFIDAVLQKVPAFRHILYNSEFKAFWKLGIICLLCDGYIKWTRLKQTQLLLENKSHFELEWTFYAMLLIAFAEYGIHVFVILLCTYIHQRLCPSTTLRFAIGDVFRGLLVANFGQLFVIPIVIIWGQYNSEIYLWLTTLFIFMSNVQVYRAIFASSRLRAWIVIMTGFISKHLLVLILPLEEMFGIDSFHEKNSF